MSSGQQATRTQGAGPVVICCAAADAGAIATVARELQAEGHTVEVVAGVESDPKRLAPVIDRCRGEGLYVLCRSRSLSRDAVDELRDVLLARHVPFGRTLTVASTRPRELRERIVASLGRVAAGQVRKMANVPPEGAPPKVRRTTQLGIPSPVVQPRPEPKPVETADEKRRRKGTQLGIPVADVAKLAQEMRAKATQPTAPPPSPEADTRVEDVLGVSAEADAPAEAEPRDGDSFSDDEEPTNTRMRAPRTPVAAAAREAREASERAHEDPPTEPLAKATSREALALQIGEPDPETETLEFGKQLVAEPQAKPFKVPPPPPPPKSGGVKPLPRPATPMEDSVGRAVITAEDLADLGGTDPKIKLSPMRPEDDFDGVPIRSGDTKVQSLEEAGLTVRSGDTAVADLAQLVRSGATMRVPAVPLPAETPTRADSSHPPLRGEMTPPAAPGAKERSSILLPAGLAGGALVLGIIVAIAFTAGDDDDAEDDDASEVAKTDGGKKPAGAEAKTSEGGGDGGGAAEGGGDGGGDAAEVAVGAPRTKVGEALRSREVLALDVLLVAAKPGGPFDYAGAQGHCDGLQVAGLDGWRLPDIGEVMSLAAAGMTGAGYYWSSTKADTFGDKHLVWYGKRARVLERAEPNFVMCVRGSVEGE